jgi:hypothetical protein
LSIDNDDRERVFCEATRSDRGCTPVRPDGRADAPVWGRLTVEKGRGCNPRPNRRL